VPIVLKSGAKGPVNGLGGAASENLSRGSLQRAIETLGGVDLGGMIVQYAPGSHPGSTFVDAVIVASDGRFSR
jgi:hypothetical protein